MKLPGSLLSLLFGGTTGIILQSSRLAAFQCTRSIPAPTRTCLQQSAGSVEAPIISDVVNSDAVEFPPPLTPLQGIARGLEFYQRVLPVFVAYKMKEFQLNYADSEDDKQRQLQELDEWGSTRIADTIDEMRGFYVKAGQVISTRVDLFPQAYTSKLQKLQDGLEPMPFELVEKVVRQELLDGAPLSELFASFEPEPLGSASIGQVHKATLLDGRTVAVKLQRPNVEPKLLGDVANLKRISKWLAQSLPVDYYTVFCELEDALLRELDFLSEAQAMRKIDMAVRHDTTGKLTSHPPVTIPLPIGELVSKRVLVMDYIDGAPLNQLSQRMAERGILPGSPEAKIGGRKILDSLTDAFGRMIFGAGFIHGDPHPGNIFIGDNGQVSLIDCGQFKALPRPQKVLLARLVLAVADYQSDPTSAAAQRSLADLVRGFGVTFGKGHERDDDLACAIALFLFGDAGVDLPGGYSSSELSNESPIRLVSSFPQELVLMARATVLIKGIAKRLDIPLSLAERWGESCRRTVDSASSPTLPLWSKPDSTTPSGGGGDDKVRFRHVASLTKDYAKGKGKRLTERAIRRLPTKLRSRLLQFIVDRQERRDAPKM